MHRVVEQNKILEKLNHALNAHYETGYDYTCLDGTRTELCEKIQGWLGHFDALLTGAHRLDKRSSYVFMVLPAPGKVLSRLPLHRSLKGMGPSI